MMLVAKDETSRGERNVISDSDGRLKTLLHGTDTSGDAVALVATDTGVLQVAEQYPAREQYSATQAFYQQALTAAAAETKSTVTVPCAAYASKKTLLFAIAGNGATVTVNVYAKGSSALDVFPLYDSAGNQIVPVNAVVIGASTTYIAVTIDVPCRELVLGASCINANITSLTAEVWQEGR